MRPLARGRIAMGGRTHDAKDGLILVFFHDTFFDTNTRDVRSLECQLMASYPRSTAVSDISCPFCLTLISFSHDS